MTNKAERDFLKRFRRFCFSGSPWLTRRVGVGTPSPFFERLYSDPHAQLEPEDFLYNYRPIVKKDVLEVYSQYMRLGQRPLSKHYLVTIVVEGNSEDETVTYCMFEYRFSGLFALHRRPLWRRRDLTIPIKEFGIDFEKSRDRWEEGIDSGWGWNLGRREIDEMFESIASRLRF